MTWPATATKTTPSSLSRNKHTITAGCSTEHPAVVNPSLSPSVRYVVTGWICSSMVRNVAHPNINGITANDATPAARYQICNPNRSAIGPANNNPMGEIAPDKLPMNPMMRPCISGATLD